MSRERWRLIRTGPLPGAMNMAVDAALLEAVARRESMPVLRLYRWSPAALTLGYAQKAAAVDFVACRRLGIDVVRRPTGGRAVLHDAEVTYAVLSPLRTAVFPGGILDTYRIIAGALREALRSLGLEAEFVPGRERGGEGAEAVCFAAPSSHELLCQGRKMTGSAQKRITGAFLQHGSIPIDLDLSRLAQLLQKGASGEDPETAVLGRKVGWLNRFLPTPVSAHEVEERLVAAFARQLGIVFEESSLSVGEWSEARALEECFTVRDPGGDRPSP